MTIEDASARLYVVCGKQQVKAVKSWLEGQNALFKGEKIQPQEDVVEVDSGVRENGTKQSITHTNYSNVR